MNSNRAYVFIACVIFLLCVSNSIHARDVGQRFILTLPEHVAHKQLCSWLSKTRPAGVMLQSSHVANRMEAKKLITFLQKETKKLGLLPLIIAIDWEGGIVSRPNEEGDFVSVPSPWSLAKGERNACFLAGMLLGHQMHSVGITMDFAPSLDVFDPNNCVLATRCFSHDPVKIAEYATAYAKGLMVYGIVPVIKHFPGLGAGRADTHFASVAIAQHDNDFERNIQPFKTLLQDGMQCVMTTHARHAQYDDVPASLSRRAVNDIKIHNPNAVIITDDFCMKAVQEGRTLEQAAMQAWDAGAHIIIFSGTAKRQIELIESLQKTYDAWPSDKKQDFEQMCNHIDSCKHQWMSAPVQIMPELNECELATYLAHRCVTVDHPMPLLIGRRVVVASVDLPRIRPMEQWFMHDAHTHLAQLLAQQGVDVSEYVYNPLDETSVEKLKNDVETDEYDYIVVQTFFYGAGKWNDVQKTWLQVLEPFRDRVISVSLGHPLEKLLLPRAYCIDAGSFHKPLLKHVEDLLTRQTVVGANTFVQGPGRYLNNKRFGLLCNNGSVVYKDQARCFLPDVLYQWTVDSKCGAKLAALLSPEHGLLGNSSAATLVSSQSSSVWHCPVHSLHGDTFKPSSDMMRNLDLVVIDLPDVGVRCFTYLSTVAYMLQAAKTANIPVLVLDRPNPLACWGAQGPRLDKSCESFLGTVHTPFLHGLTIGTIAEQENKNIGADLTVLSCTGDDALFFNQPFIPPSPNLRSIDHVYAYPLTVLLEGTNYSEGRGTLYPFVQFGAPWVDAEQLATQLNSKKLPGLYCEPITFQPRSMPRIAENPKHKGNRCQGVFIHITDHQNVQPIKTAKTILKTLFHLYPEQSQLLRSGKRYMLDILIGTEKWRKELERLTLK